MDEIFKQYGGPIITAIAAGCIFAMFFVSWNRLGQTDADSSILSDIGQNATTVLGEAEDHDANSDKQQFDIYATRALPTVRAKKHADEYATFNLIDVFEIKDCDGYVWNATNKRYELNGNNRAGVVQVTSITYVSDANTNGTSTVYGYTWDVATKSWNNNTTTVNKNGTNVPVIEFNTTTYNVCFNAAGTYYVQLRVLDYYNVETNVTIPLAVDLVIP